MTVMGASSAGLLVEVAQQNPVQRPFEQTDQRPWVIDSGRSQPPVALSDTATPLATLSDPSYEHEKPWPTSAVK